MESIIPIERLLGLIAEAVNVGRRQVLIDAGLERPFVSKAEAYRRFGKKNVDNWEALRLIRPVKDSEKARTLRFDVERLNELALSVNVSGFIAECEINRTLEGGRKPEGAP